MLCRTIQFALILGGVLLLMGCLIVPIPGRKITDNNTHQPITDERQRALKEGSTTRQQAVDIFGPPSLTRCQDRLLVYSWSTRREVRTYFATCFGAKESVDERGETHFLLLEFDGQDILRHRRTHHGGSIREEPTGIEDAIVD